MRLMTLFLLLACALAEDPPSLRDLLGNYESDMAERGGSDTIPVEQAMIRARDAGEYAMLAEFAGHPRFGAEILWALGEARKEESKALAAFRTLPLPARLEAAFHVGNYASEAARKALLELRDDPALEASMRPIVESALLRAGETKAREAVRAALAGKDAEKAAEALLRLGDARASEFLGEALRRATDATKLANPPASRFEERTRTDGPDGSYTESTTFPSLPTLGEVALEAASRMVASTTPPRIGWWYDVERGRRFPSGEEGAKRLRQWVEADRKAGKAKAVGAQEAVSALFRRLRADAPEGPMEVSVLSVEFDKAWTIRYRLSGEEASATVDAAGAVAG